VWHNAKFLNITACGTYTYHWNLNGLYATLAYTFLSPWGIYTVTLYLFLVGLQLPHIPQRL